MNGFGDDDDGALHAMILVENEVALARSMLPSGQSMQHCLECGDDIPQARRQAMPGVKYCVECQISHDKRPRVRIVDYIL